MIYILNIYSLENSKSSFGFSESVSKVFYLNDAVKVCEIMSQIPKDHYVTLAISEFSSIDDVLNYVKNGCRSSKSSRD